MELNYVIVGLIVLIIQIIFLAKFFQMSSDVSKIKDYISGSKTFKQCIDAVELEIVKGNKTKALELLKVAEYLNKHKEFAGEEVTKVKFDNLVTAANDLK